MASQKKECLKCKKEALVKNGHIRGKQRYKCKDCGYQFTVHEERGRPFRDRVIATMLYLSGVSIRHTAKILGVRHSTVSRWLVSFAKQFAPLPQPSAEPVEVEIDEMWHFLQKKVKSAGFGKCYVVKQDDCFVGLVVAEMKGDSWGF